MIATNMFFKEKAYSYYVTNFPVNTTEAELWRILIRIGKLLDVLIARKRNKFGGCFGFARFLDIIDPQGFEKKMNNTWVGGMRLKANISRFERDARPSMVHGEKLEKNVGRNIHMKTSGNDGEKRLYADVLKGEVEKQSQEESPLVTMVSSPMTKDWLGESLFGRVNTINNFWSIASFLRDDGCEDVKLRYIGGIHVLLEFDYGERASNFLENSKEIWCKWFDVLERWNPGFSVPNRMASITIQGILVHAWSCEAFSAIAIKWGEIVLPEECNSENSNLSMGRVGILTDQFERIDYNGVVEVDKIKYKVCVSEDMVESRKIVPDFCMSFSPVSNDLSDSEEDGGNMFEIDSLFDDEADREGEEHRLQSSEIKVSLGENTTPENGIPDEHVPENCYSLRKDDERSVNVQEGEKVVHKEVKASSDKDIDVSDLGDFSKVFTNVGKAAEQATGLDKSELGEVGLKIGRPKGSTKGVSMRAQPKFKKLDKKGKKKKKEWLT